MPGTSFTLLLGLAPAPASVVDAVQEIEVEAATDVASACRLRLAIAQTQAGDWRLLEQDLFRPLVPLSVRVGTGIGVPQALFNGYVTHQQATYSEEPGGSVLEITALDSTHLMNLEEKVMPWPNLPDSAIAAAIFGQYGLVPRVRPTSPGLVETDGTTTQRGTDIRFLRALARRNGFLCYVQPEPITGIDQAFFEPDPEPLGPPQAVINVNMGAETNVEGFVVRYEMSAPTSARASAIDPSNKAIQPVLTPVSTQTAFGAEPTLTRVVPPPSLRPAGLGAPTTGTLQTAVQAIVDSSSWAVHAEGTVAAEMGILRPGKLLNVRGAGRVLSGSYLAERISHHLTRDGAYTQSFSARRNAVGLTGSEVYFAQA